MVMQGFESLSREQIKTLLQRSVAEYIKDDCGHLAAAISYYTLFSIFPLLIFAVSIVGLVIQDRGVQDDIINEVLKNIPLNEGEGRNSVKQSPHAACSRRQMGTFE